MRGVFRFSVLGLLSIADDARTVVLQSSKPMILLAAMLLYPNEPVTNSFLQRAAWGDEPPDAARATLQTYVMRLRQTFKKHGLPGDAIETVPGGYRLPVTENTSDLVQFRSLLRSAGEAESPEAELGLIRSALELWRGEPLSNIESEMLHRDVTPRLTEEWLRASERCFDLELSMGRCRHVVAELRSATRAHPGHERFAEQLIEALYRTGRQTDALAEYQMVRQYLARELGVDPGPSLQRLQLAILRGDQVGCVAPESVVRQSTTGLPGDVRGFAGRQAEISDLAKALTSPDHGPTVAVISGPPGVGKTALAVHVAHLVSGHFVNGVSFTDAVDATRPPDGSLLIVDGATDAEQVRSILPTTGNAAVIVTSRLGFGSLAGGYGALTQRLDVLTAEESCAMLASILGRARIDAEPDAVRTLAALCQHHPLSLRVAATRLRLRPRHRVADLVHWLNDDPLERLSSRVGDTVVTIADIIRRFIDEMEPWAASAFYALAATDGARITEHGCAEILKLTDGAASALLDHLVDVSLVVDDVGGAYLIPPLLRTIARSRVAVSAT